MSVKGDEQMDMRDWKDGLYSRDEICPFCGSTNTSVAIHGAIRQWWCQNCGQPFMPELDRRKQGDAANAGEGRIK